MLYTTCVMPNASNRRIANGVAIILGTALLYFIFEDEQIMYLVRNTNTAIATNQTLNPVLRIPIKCTGNKCEVYIDAITPEPN